MRPPDHKDTLYQGTIILLVTLSVFSTTKAANLPLNFLTRFMKGSPNNSIANDKMSKSFGLYDAYDTMPLAVYNKGPHSQAELISDMRSLTQMLQQRLPLRHNIRKRKFFFFLKGLGQMGKRSGGQGGYHYGHSAIRLL